MNARIPRRASFPFGYTVTIVQVTDREMRDREEIDADEDISDGCWFADTRTIYLRKALPPRRKRYILGHELMHAVLDWQHHYFNAEAMKP